MEKLDHHLVSFSQTFLRESQKAKAITFEWIGAGKIEGDITVKVLGGLMQCELDSCKIFFILATAWQGNIEVTIGFSERVIVVPMNRAGEQGRVSFGDAGGAVALVNVTIKKECSTEKPLFLQNFCRNTNVIKYAISLSAIGKTMVRATGKIA